MSSRASRAPPNYRKMGVRGSRHARRPRSGASPLSRYLLILISLALFLLILTVVTLQNFLEGSLFSSQHYTSDFCSLCNIDTIKLWKSFQTQILESSQHPDDPTYSHKEWTRDLLAGLDPSKLSFTTHSGSTNINILENKSIHHISEIFQQHLTYHHHQTQKSPNKKQKHLLQPPSPLKIAVVGGSLTEGNGCTFSKSVQPPKGSIMSNPTYCAWPYRLEAFLNRILLRTLVGTVSRASSVAGVGYDLVKVVNMAEDGTETALMTPLLRNWLYPSELLPEGPDVVINAYSMSDYTISSPAFNEAEAENGDVDGMEEALKAKILNEMIAFVQAVEASHPCGKAPPLVIHLYDDPSKNNDITESLQESLKGMTEIPVSNMLVINYSDIIEAAATLEEEYYEKHKDDKKENEDMYDDDEVKLEQKEKKNRLEKPDLLVRGTPFGMAGHVLLSWVVAYRCLELLIQYCIENQKQRQPISSELRDTTNIQQNNFDTTEIAVSCQDPSSGDTCVFGWFAGPAGTVFKPTEINKYIEPYLLYKENWEASTDMSAGYSRKTGLVATAPNAIITFEVPNISKEVQYINLMVLKSSLPTFLGGVAQFTIVVEDSNKDVKSKELTFAIDGSSHDNSRPMTYPVEVDLKDFKAPIGSTLRLTIELIHGQSFKLLGMMFCS